MSSILIEKYILLTLSIALFLVLLGIYVFLFLKLKLKKAFSQKIIVISGKQTEDFNKDDINKGDITEFITIIDGLLEKLPDKVILDFSNSKSFGLYKKIVNEKDAKISSELKQIAPIIDNLLEKLPDKIIDEFSESKDFKLYKLMMRRLL